jgi:hypothetical protein
MAPVPLVQQQSNNSNLEGPSHAVGDRRGSVLRKLRPHWLVSFRKTR